MEALPASVCRKEVPIIITLRNFKIFRACFMGEISIRDLAKQLNLSIGTVSKALRDSHEISSVTKEKVFTLARKLNYIPNPYASSLRGKKVIPLASSFLKLQTV